MRRLRAALPQPRCAVGGLSTVAAGVTCLLSGLASSPSPVSCVPLVTRSTLFSSGHLFIFVCPLSRAPDGVAWCRLLCLAGSCFFPPSPPPACARGTQGGRWTGGRATRHSNREHPPTGFPPCGAALAAARPWPVVAAAAAATRRPRAGGRRRAAGRLIPRLAVGQPRRVRAPVAVGLPTRTRRSVGRASPDCRKRVALGWRPRVVVVVAPPSVRVAASVAHQGGG